MDTEQNERGLDRSRIARLVTSFTLMDECASAADRAAQAFGALILAIPPDLDLTAYDEDDMDGEDA